MSQSRRIKGGTTDEVFKEPCFLWERAASGVWTLNFFTFQDLFIESGVFERGTSKTRTAGGLEDRDGKTLN